LLRIHGNWCGPTWTGGHKHEYRLAPPDYYLPPTDSMDVSCREHDICYWRCRDRYPCDKDARVTCKVECDRVLASKGRRLGGHRGITGWMEYNNRQGMFDEGNAPGCGCKE
jgi:hypothetical protein